jgi:hypothetical protein
MLKCKDTSSVVVFDVHLESVSQYRLFTFQEVLTVVGMFLEIDTAVGKTAFSADLKQALTNALSANYSFCNSRRLCRRDLQDGLNIQLGDISIVETAGTLHTRKSERLHSWSYTLLPTRRFI